MREADPAVRAIHHWSHHDSTLQTVLRPTRRLGIARRARAARGLQQGREDDHDDDSGGDHGHDDRADGGGIGAGDAASAPLKVAFAYVGPVGDGGWTFAHDNARKALQQHFGDKIVTSFVEKVPEAADAERVFRDMVSQGNKLIFGTTFGYMEPMLKVAADNPNVKFEHATGYKTAPNMRTYDSRTYEGAYMAGVIAGGMTKTNILGVVGSIPIPEVIRNIDSFTHGRAVGEPEGQDQGRLGQRMVQPAQGDRSRAVAHQRRRRRADAEHRLVGGAADGRARPASTPSDGTAT